MKYLVHLNEQTIQLTSEQLEHASLIKSCSNQYQLRVNNAHYNAEILEVNLQQGTVILKTDRKKRLFRISTPLDQLINELGFNAKNTLHDDALVAPMPGLVLEVKVAVGQSIQKGDPLLTLEAMKMENILRSQHDGIIQEIKTTSGDKVEKNQPLIIFKSVQNVK